MTRNVLFAFVFFEVTLLNLMYIYSRRMRVRISKRNLKHMLHLDGRKKSFEIFTWTMQIAICYF
jgi:hypothetical protein